MKSRFLIAAALGATFITHQANASAVSGRLQALLERVAEAEVKPNDVANLMQGNEALCKEIKDKNFYQAATDAGVPPIKRAKIMNFCERVVFEEASLVKPKIKEKATEPARERVQLRPVQLGAGGDVAAQENELDEARRAILENAEILGRRAEIVGRVAAAEKLVADARDHYNNLQVAILSMREDLTHHLSAYRNPGENILAVVDELKAFNTANAASTPEVFLDNFQALSQVAKDHLGRVYTDQITAARGVLAEANQNLANARRDLAAINEELIALAK